MPFLKPCFFSSRLCDNCDTSSTEHGQNGGAKKIHAYHLLDEFNWHISFNRISWIFRLFSKEMIIEAVHFSDSMYSNLIYYFLLAGVFITSLYSFRMFFLVFHGESRMSEADLSHIHELLR